MIKWLLLAGLAAVGSLVMGWIVSRFRMIDGKNEPQDPAAGLHGAKEGAGGKP